MYYENPGGILPKSSSFDDGLGAAEQWTEPYVQYGEGAAQTGTTPGAKSSGGVPSSDREQADAARGISVHDGFPNPATDTSLKSLDLNRLLIWHSASTFMLRVSGNDWEDIGIFSEDIALVDRALNPRPVDLVVWQRQDAFAISAYTALKEGSEVWGVVTAVIHQYRKR